MWLKRAETFHGRSLPFGALQGMTQDQRLTWLAGRVEPARTMMF